MLLIIKANEQTLAVKMYFAPVLLCDITHFIVLCKIMLLCMHMYVTTCVPSLSICYRNWRGEEELWMSEPRKVELHLGSNFPKLSTAHLWGTNKV